MDSRFIFNNFMPKSPEKIAPEQQAEIERERTYSDAKLLKEGGKYVIEAGEKRLELTGQQVEAIRHEMMRDFFHRAEMEKYQARKNKFLAELGIESLDGVPQYYLGDIRNIPGVDGAACCRLEDSIGRLSREDEKNCNWGGDVKEFKKFEEFNDKDIVLRILEAFYVRNPELRSLDRFLLYGDFGLVLVRCERMDWLGHQ